MRKTDASGKLSLQGDQEAAQGKWPQALNDYQQALTLYPYEERALYALGDDSLRNGELAAAVAYYRKAIYSPPDATTPLALAPVFHESNVFRLMEYARLLSLTGQQEEALIVYRRGAHFLNYLDGHQHLKVMLPDFGADTGQIPFTPQRLQALAQVGWAEDHADFDRPGAWARLQQAVALYPDSPVPYFYRGYHKARYSTDYLAASADFDKATQLGNAVTADAVQQERHLFRSQIDAASRASQLANPSP